LVLVLAVSAAIAGCGSETPSATPDAAKPDDTAATPAQTEPSDDDAGLVALELTTDGERAALELAKSAEGRMWANGNWQSGPEAQGEPTLVGYVVQLYDGASTGYQLLVLDGKVCSMFSAQQPPVEAQAIIEFPYDGTNLYTWVEQPESSAQQEAVEAAIAYLKDTRGVTATAGIENYVFAFPKTNGSYPMVQVFANTETGTFSSGSNGFTD